MVAITGLQSLRSSIIVADKQQKQNLLQLINQDVKDLIINNLYFNSNDSTKHELSACEILTTLFFSVLRFDSESSEWPERDRFILSKGSCLAALYAVLAQCGFIPIDDLASFMAQSHLNNQLKHKIPWIEVNDNSPERGLIIGVECSPAARLSGRSCRTFVLLGDGDLQEGSSWKAAITAGQTQLPGLTVIVNCNWLDSDIAFEKRSQLRKLITKWHSLGWDTSEIDGHDFEQLYATLSAAPVDRPRCVIARTQKGRDK